GRGSDLFIFYADSGQAAVVLGGSGTAGTISGFKTLTDFLPGSTATSDRFDVLSLFGLPTIPGNVAGSDGADSGLLLPTGGAVASHAITDGVISFDDQDSFAAAISLTSMSDVAAAVDYLQHNNLGNMGATVAFLATIGGQTHTFVWTQASLLVDLV